MRATRQIDGHEVIFTTWYFGDKKWIDVRVVGGGFGPSPNWIEAWSLMREMVANAVERDALALQLDAERKAARLARVAKHEAKQKRRAPGQSLRAKLTTAGVANV